MIVNTKTLKNIIKEELSKLLREENLEGMLHPNPSSIGLQVFATKRGKFNPDRFMRSLIKGKIPVYSKPMGRTDKPYPAFWTSTLKNSTTGWLDLCRDPDFWQAQAGEQAVIYEILPEARILVMSSESDYEAIRSLYPKKTPKGGEDMYIMFGGKHPLGGEMLDVVDWTAVSKDYDAIYCSTGTCAPGWDVESCAWWNLNVLKQIKIVDINDQCELVMDGEA